MRESIHPVALFAHDGKKADMMAFAIQNKETMSNFELTATGTTGKLLEDKVGLTVDQYLYGPLGGDMQIVARAVIQ